MNHKDNIYIKIWRCTVCRIGIILFASIIAIIFLLSVLANPILNWVVKPQVVNSVNSSEKTQLSIGGVDFSPFQNRLLAFNSNITLNDSSRSSVDTTNISAPVISINGLNWFALIFQSGYSVGDVIIEKPSLRILNYSNSNEKPQDKKSTNNSDSQDSSFAQKIVFALPENINPLTIGRIQINSADVVKVIHAEDKTIDSVKNLSFSFSDINIDKDLDYKNDSSTLFSSFAISVEGIHKKMFGPGYDFKIETINLNSDKSELLIKGLNFQPFIPDKDFFKGDIYRADRLIINIPEIKINEPDLIKFFNENSLTIKGIFVPQFHIEIFTNRRLPIDPSTRPKMPHELIALLDFKLEIEKFEIDNSLLILESVMPNVERRAQLRITNVEASISNVSNIPQKQSSKNPFIMEASGDFMDEGKLQIKLEYNLLSDNLNFNYEGSMGEMELDLLNSHLEVEDKTEIKSGKIITANFSSDVENGISSVNIIPLYQELKIVVLEEESIEKILLPTLLANATIRSSNPDEEGKIKSGNVTYTRKATDTFMDVIWLAVLKGIGEVVGF